nr:MAG TPA: hypothetical protein [Caudoviricetes sp.]
MNSLTCLCLDNNGSKTIVCKMIYLYLVFNNGKSRR